MYQVVLGFAGWPAIARLSIRQQLKPGELQATRISCVVAWVDIGLD
jgi:hypothetical protein